MAGIVERLVAETNPKRFCSGWVVYWGGGGGGGGETHLWHLTPTPLNTKKLFYHYISWIYLLHAYLSLHKCIYAILGIS